MRTLESIPAAAPLASPWTRPPSGRVLVSLLLFLFSTVTTSCVDTRPWRVQERPWTEATIADAEQVRATQPDGATIVLEDARLDAAAGELSGTAVNAVDAQEVTLSLAALTMLETSRQEQSRILGNVAAGLGIAAVVVIGLVAIAIYAVFGA